MTEKQTHLIQLLADGETIERAKEDLKCDPHNVPIEDIEKWLRDPEILKAAIKLSNDLIGQAWGTMWGSIKQKAMLGSVQHAKMLIEYVQNNNRLPENELRFIFDEAVAGRLKRDVESNVE